MWRELNPQGLSGDDMKKRLLTLCALFILSGCAASSGKNFDESALTKIHNGVTTRQQLIALFGQPTSETPYPEGHTLMMWSYSQARTMSTTEGKTLTVQLNKGKVFSYAVSKT